jgi:hypothetical protein
MALFSCERSFTMRTLWITPVLATVLLTGCGDMPSVEGLANKDNIVFDPALVGAWNAGDAVVIVQKGDDQSYRIHWLGTDGMDTPRIVRMEGRLVTLGDQRILDLTAANPGAFVVPGHVFLRIQPVMDGLKVQFVDSKWIRGQAATLQLAGFAQDSHPVLTAQAPQIAAFLLKFGFDERALDDPMMLRPLKQN